MILFSLNFCSKTAVYENPVHLCYLHLRRSARTCAHGEITFSTKAAYFAFFDSDRTTDFYLPLSSGCIKRLSCPSCPARSNLQ